MTTVADETFLQRMRTRAITEQPSVSTSEPFTTTTVFDLNGDRARKRALAALADEARQMATTGEYRNAQFRDAMWKLWGFVNDGALAEQELIDAMMDAGRRASRLGDHPFTDTEMLATINGTRRNPSSRALTRPIPESSGYGPAYTIDADDEDAPSEDEKRDLHQLQVARRAYEYRVNDEARVLWTRQRAAAAGQQPPQLINLVDLLAQPDRETAYRINELLPIGGRVLLAAQYKAGKTSMIANLLRSLVDGTAFLGRLHVEPVGRIVLIDNELDIDMLRRWLRDQGIRNCAAIDLVCLRGRLTTFGITDDTIRADWAKIMTGADFIVLDCLRPCLDALGLSEDKDAGIFLTAFDALCREAGAREAAVVHHMGHGQERSRGDSRLLDWPDVLWKIVRDDDEGENGDRFFSAFGRDVNLPEAQLDWNPETRSLTLCNNGGRADKRARNMGVDIIEIMSDPANQDGLSKNRLEGKLKALGNSRDGARRAIQMAVNAGTLLTIDGPRNSKLHILNPSEQI